MKFHSFEDVLAHLDSLGLFHMNFELHRVRRAASVLGLDGFTSGGSRAPVVQIVGTNGKGSTATFLESLARAHGLKTGLHTSPHFVTPRERIRVNGAMLPPEAWTELASEVHAAAPDLTYFEFLTVLSFLAFVRDSVDLMIMEAGLGGRYDATTGLRADLVCFTPIALDHEKVLGPTIQAIAADKAEAMREGRPALTGPQPPEAMQSLKVVAATRGAALFRADEVVEFPADTRLGLAGPHQLLNARLALAAWRLLARENGWETSPEAVTAGLAGARIAGRMQFVPAREPEAREDGRFEPSLILDGGHNPHGLAALAKALADAGLKPRAVIFSCLADKNVEGMLPLIRDIAGDAPIFVPSIQDNDRALAGEELAARLGSRAAAVPRLRAALDAVAGLVPPPSAERPVVLCGSLYLLGEFFTLRPRWLEEKSFP